jgi:hypothetical protein
MNLDRSKKVTALTLLDAFGRCFPNDTKIAEPDEEAVRQYPSAYFRLRQLRAMFAAFGIPFNPESFSSGRFIREREKTSDRLVEQLFPKLPESASEGVPSLDLNVLFRAMRDYRQGMARGRDSFGYFLCWPRLIGYAVSEVITPINEEIERIMAPVDEMLATLISPDGKTFTIGELIDGYGYPDEDIESLQWKEPWEKLFSEDDGR